MKLPLSTVLQSLDQAESKLELNKAVDVLLNNFTANIVQADIVDDNDDDDMRQGSIKERRTDDKMVSSNHVRSLLVEVLLLHKKFVALQKAYKAVQSYVDLDTLNILNTTTIWISTKSDALKAMQIYNSAWFSSLPLSIESKVNIAQSLSDTCLQFGVTNGFWQQLVDYNDAAVEMSIYTQGSN
jgi:hypothetical protein